MAKFKVYGDYGYVSECELFESDSQNEAVRWATQYTKDGDFGGYNIIEVAFFYPNGEYETVLTMNANGATIYEEDYSDQSAYSYNL